MAATDWLNSVTQGKTGRVNFTGVGAEYKKRQAEQDKFLANQRKKIDEGLNKGLSFEDIAKKTGVELDKIRTYTAASRPEYGTDTRSLVKKTTDTAKGVGQSLASSYDRLSKGVAETVNFDTAAQKRANLAEEAVLTSNTKLINDAAARLKDPNTPPEQKAKIRELVKKVAGKNLDQFQSSNVINKEIQERVDPVKGAASVASIGFDVLTAGSAGAATKAGSRGAAIAKNVASGAAQGAVSGGFGAVEEKGTKVTTEDLKRGAATGAAFGGALTAAGGGLGAAKKYFSDIKAGKITKASEEFAKKNPTAARIIRENAESQTPTVADTTVASATPEPPRVPRSGTQTFTGKVDKATASKISEVEKAASVTPRPEGTTRVFQAVGKGGESDWVFDDLDSLKAFKNNTTASTDSFTFRDVPDSQLSPTNRGEHVFKLQESPDVPIAGVDQGTSKLAVGTEAKAIKEGLTEGFGDLPKYNKVNWDEQASKVVDYMDADYEAAKQIALGNKKAPDGILENAFYNGVEARALREGDDETLYRLAKESKLTTKASRAGQEIGILSQRNPESPVTAMNKVLEARANSKIKGIPIDLNPTETKTINSMSRDLAEKKAAIAHGADRMEYGRARVAYDNYVDGLILEANKPSIKERLKPGKLATDIAGNSKAIKASLDNSAIFRQGWKTLFTNPVVWQRNARKTFGDAVKTFGGKNTLDELKADIISRPNADIYKQMKLDVMGVTEEAFPTSLPEKIPVAGRFYKASEAAYTGFVQKTRADVADKLIEVAQKSNVDLTDKKQLESIGKLVNALTGRGHLGKLEPAGKVVNNIFFSPRNLKSNVDMLTAHQFQKGVTPFVRRQAAQNLLKVVGGTAAVLATASALKPGSVEWDPRSSNFGKIKIGNTRFDVSGGMASIVTLASRLITKSTKSSTSNQVTKLNQGGFGDPTSLDVLLNFTEGKLSPVASVLADVLKGKDFEGNKPTAGSIARDLGVPLGITNYQELRKDPKSANDLVAVLAEGLGIGTNTYSAQKDWNQTNSKQISGFKSAVSQKDFQAANQAYNDEFNTWFEAASGDKRFKALSESTRQSLVSSKKQQLTKDILERYGYEYKKPTKSDEEKDTVKELQGL